MLRAGGLIGHQTSTLAGVAASAYSKAGIKKAQRFKQRQGPFLLLTDSVSTALKQAIYISPTLRKQAKTSWPGAVTLVFRAKQHLDKAVYHKGLVAIRVDADAETRRLANQCGGFLLSSSLNRKGQVVQALQPRLRFHWQRHLSMLITPTQQPSGQASQIIQVSGNKTKQLR